MGTFVHALTGASMTPAPGSRLEELVTADENWVEAAPAPAKKSAAKPPAKK